MQDSPLSDIKIGKITAEWAKARQIPVLYKESLASTNELAKNEAFKEKTLEENVFLYLTDHQSKGRGRGENIWLDAHPGSSLLSSWSFFLDQPPRPVTSPRTGLALFKAASATWPFLPWALKAPNDLFLGDKKVAGLLLENVTQGDESRLIIGIGFNITSYPENLEAATSLVNSLPSRSPLLGEDYINFLDRLFFEISLVVEKQQDPLSSTEGAALTYALNLKPGKSEKYISVGEDGTIQTSERTLSWTDI